MSSEHPKPRRNVELMLLLLALLIGIGAQVLVGLSVEDEINHRYWVEGGARSPSPWDSTWSCGCAPSMPTRSSCRSW